MLLLITCYQSQTQTAQNDSPAILATMHCRSAVRSFVSPRIAVIQFRSARLSHQKLLRNVLVGSSMQCRYPAHPIRQKLIVTQKVSSKYESCVIKSPELFSVLLMRAIQRFLSVLQG